MKKNCLQCFALAFILVFSFFGCSNTEKKVDSTTSAQQSTGAENRISEQDKAAIEKSIQAFFRAFEKGSYEDMKAYCTDDFVKAFYHEKDVFGMRYAKLNKITDSFFLDTTAYEKYGTEKDYCVHVTLQAVFTETAAVLTSENAYTDFDMTLILQKQENGKWLLNTLSTEF